MNEIKIALSTGWRFDCAPTLKDSFQLASKLGLDGLELVINNENIFHGKKFVKNLSEKYKLPILGIHCSIISMPFLWPFKRGIKRVFNYASFLKAPLVVIHPPYMQGYTSNAGRKLVSYLSREQNKQNDFLITLENFEKDNKQTYRSLEKLKEILDRFNLNLTFDTTHVGISNYNLFEAYEIFKDKIKNIHLSNQNAGAEHLPPFKGELPLNEFLKKLKFDNYKGTITLELLYHPFVSRKRVRKDLEKSIKFIKKNLQ